LFVWVFFFCVPLPAHHHHTPNAAAHPHCTTLPDLSRELAGRLAKTQKKFADWQDRLKNTDTSADGSFTKLHGALARGVNALVKLVNHAEQSVKAVERQRDKYAQITDGELHSRKMYVTQTRRRIRSMKETMNSATTKAKIDGDKRAKLMGRRQANGGGGGGGPGMGSGGAKNQSNNEFYQSSQQDQRQLRRQQDETMDAMGSSVETLNEYAVEIGRELDSQKVLLDEFGNEIETVQTRMDKILGGMQKLLKTKSELRGGEWEAFGGRRGAAEQRGGQDSFVDLFFFFC
jgi:hypothetical protein